MSRRYITTVSILIGLPILVLVGFRRTIIDAVTSPDFWSAHWGDAASVSGLVLAWYGFIAHNLIAVDQGVGETIITMTDHEIFRIGPGPLQH